MKKLILSLSLPVVGLVLSLAIATAAHAADVPNYDQLYQQTQQQAKDQVDAKMAENPTPDADQLRTQANTQVGTATSGNSTSTSTTSASGGTNGTSAVVGGNGTNVPAGANVIVLNTGDNVKLNTSNDQSSTTSVTNNNDATINQTVNGSANTGNNTANRNISIGGNAGSIQTGNASVNGSASASGNSNYTAISGSCQNVVSNVDVYNTGDNLDHNSGTSNTCNTSVTNNNNTTINQVVNGSATTGGNQAERNIAIGGGSAGQIVSGNANVGSLVTSQGNQNVVIIGGQSSNGGPGSGANIYILNTGDNADLSSRYRYATTTSVTNNNTFSSTQEVNANADTGHNTADRNINANGDAGVIKTGDAVVNTSLSAQGNKNTTLISGSGGSATTNVNIVNTGDNLHSNTDTSVNNTTTVTNNNTATINQTVNASANTGYNQANRNIAFGGDAGVIETGDAIVNTSVKAAANENVTVISGAEGHADSNVNVINTGDHADISANSSETNTVAVVNNNVANVNQQVNVDANTGNNEANRNIGGGSITTGGVTVNTNVVSNANGSYTFVIDSATTGMDVFNQFLQLLMGKSLQEVLSQYPGSVVTPGSTGSNDTSVTNTGDDATVLANHTSTRTVMVTNNNEANINQYVNVSANTGSNTCNRNVGGCDIKTGDVTVTTTLVANANWNFTIIGNVGVIEKPSTPETPETPTTTEQPKAGPNPATPAVLAAVTTNGQGGVLPNTGAGDVTWIGLALIAAGALLRRKAQIATVNA
jgi:LPXTG-motif cell wall-anchored protein